MNNKSLFYGEEACGDFLKFVKQNCGFYKCVIVCTKHEELKNSKLFKSVCEATKKHSFVELPSNITNTTLIERLIKKEISDEVGLVIVVNNFKVAGKVSRWFKNVALICKSPSLCALKSKSNIVVYDFNIIKNCSLHEFVSCFGEIVSTFAFLVENVFCACVYNEVGNREVLVKLEKVLLKLSTMPISVLQSNVGRTYFLKLVLIVSNLLSENFEGSCVKKLAQNLNEEHKDSFSFGCALGYSAKIIFEAINYILGVNKISGLIGFSADKRLQQFSETCINNDNFIGENLTNFNSDINSLSKNFDLIKNDFSLLLLKYNKMFFKLYNKFLLMQFDKGVSHNKFLTPHQITNAFNKLPEQSERANFVTFLRAFGFLNCF